MAGHFLTLQWNSPVTCAHRASTHFVWFLVFLLVLEMTGESFLLFGYVLLLVVFAERLRDVLFQQFLFQKLFLSLFCWEEAVGIGTLLGPVKIQVTSVSDKSTGSKVYWGLLQESVGPQSNHVVVWILVAFCSVGNDTGPCSMRSLAASSAIICR